VVNPGIQYREAMASAAVAVLSVNAFVIAGTLFPDSFGVRITLSTAGYVGLALVGALLLGVAWFVSLQRSHALAGPVYAITREIAKLGEGDVGFRINLRPGDGFHQEALRINAAADQLREQIHQIKVLAVALEQATSMVEVERISTELSRRLSALNTMPERHRERE
jgi:methyl-accepting chemotaxis protein